MQKVLHLLLALSMLSIRAQAQCNATFGYSVNQNTVSFYAHDSIPSAWHTWHFGDGSAASTYNPVHVYAQSGQYTVLHIVHDTARHCTDSLSRIITVNVAPPSCNVGFRYEKTAIPGQYNFYAQVSIMGTQLKELYWSINGVKVSNQQNFSYTFTHAGKYYVCANIETASGCTSQKCDSIDYRPYANCNIRSSFTYRKDSIQSGLIYFNASPDLPQLRYNWSFGDGQQGFGANTSHLYSGPGTYRVRLIITDSVNHCQDSTIQSIAVNVSSSDTCTGLFTYINNQRGQVSFTAVSNQPVATQTWVINSLGDSLPVVVLNTFNPVYTFTDTGTYSVCLWLVTNTGCKRRFCGIIRINTLGKKVPVVPSYPNPVSGESTIRLNINMKEAGVIRYSVSNLGGNAVYQSQRQGNKGMNAVTIPVNQLGRGQYFITINYEGQERRSLFQKL